ncbi:hypothetical protein GCM10009864_59170 [Streptomyces lunalinharesii]|uniref:Transposase n=1 Tax=Streptomyces lunalinharesii TaxID=333384 RepID=A0ABP6F1U2_9ACTN
MVENRAVAALVPSFHQRRLSQKKVLEDRKVLCRVILFVLHTGIPWEQPPGKLGFGTRVTCWR